MRKSESSLDNRKFKGILWDNFNTQGGLLLLAAFIFKDFDQISKINAMACATLKRTYEFDPLTPQHQPSPKRRRCTPLKPSTPPPTVTTESHFRDVAPRLSQDQVSASIHQEWRRLQRRRHLRVVPSPSSPEMASFSSYSPGSSPPRKEQPLFTLKQVTLICERMLKEREAQVTEEYDKVLREKLAEQYDAFVKFNYDQVQRRFQETAPTYVS